MTTNIATCQIVANESYHDFGTVAAGSESDLFQIQYTNNGTFSINLSIWGTLWDDGSGHTLEVNSTYWGTSELAPCTSGTQMTGSNATIIDDLAADATQDIWYCIKVPSDPLPYASTYSQTVYVEGTC